MPKRGPMRIVVWSAQSGIHVDDDVFTFGKNEFNRMTRNVDDRFEQLHAEVVGLQVWNFRYSVVIGPERRERSRGSRVAPPHAHPAVRDGMCVWSR